MKERGAMTPGAEYEERVSSPGTEALFVGLVVLFLVLFFLRVRGSGWGCVAGLFLLLLGLFLFYTVNYRTLVIRITSEALHLRFGVFSWAVPWDLVAHWHRDDTPLWRVGGAGIHFTMIRRRYRVFFNFLEHPRVVLELKRSRGLVRDVAFSTARPEELLLAVAGRAGRQNRIPSGG
jgi:hypothetical protein